MDIRRAEYSEYVTLIVLGELIWAVICGVMGATLVLLAVHYWKQKTNEKRK